MDVIIVQFKKRTGDYGKINVKVKNCTSEIEAIKTAYNYLTDTVKTPVFPNASIVKFGALYNPTN